MRAVIVSFVGAALFAILFAIPVAQAEVHSSWDSYIKKNRYTCPGPFDTLAKGRKIELGGKKYTHTGFQMAVDKPDDDSTVKIGVISAIKDVTEGTKKNFADTMSWFKSAGVEWVVANGDLALEEFDLEEVLGMLGSSGFPVLIVLGNSESKGSFARVYKEQSAKYPNLINGALVRQIIADDIEFWTLPGYFDKRFAHAGAFCSYNEDHVAQLGNTLKPSGKAPVALVSHGPPRGKGRSALDWVTAGENVGDEEMAALIKDKQIPFGLFGHILEAGGAAVGKDMSKPIKSGKPVPELYLNAGSLSGDPWGMNDGSTSYGLALLVTIEDSKATYEVKRYPNRVE